MTRAWQRYNASYSSPNGTYRQRYTGQSVDAAVTGALIIDGQDVALSEAPGRERNGTARVKAKRFARLDWVSASVQ